MINYKNMRWIPWTLCYICGRSISTFIIIFVPNRDYMRFRDQIISSRVHLIDNWQSTFSNVEKLYYDYGVKGPSDGVDIYKGECDASFDSNSKTATLAFIIWKDDKVLWSQVIRGFDCGSAQEAEACAALALVWKATELEKGTITNLIVYTDSMPTAGIMSGSMTIKRNDRNFGLYMLLRGTRQRFDRLIAEWKSRELQFLPDALASSQDVDYGPLYTGTILKKFSYHLSGLPLFKLSQSTKSKEITSKFVSRKYNEALDSRYYLVVENKDQFAALAKVTRTLKPGLVYAAIHNIECKPTDFQQKAYGFSGAAQIGEFTFSFAKFNFHSEDTDTTGPKGARPIIFVFDLTVPEASYAHLNGFTIFLVSPKERGVMRSRGIRELNALSYIYYHGVIEGGDSLEAEGDGGEEPGEEVLAVSLSHPKFWWGPDLAWPRRGEILSMKSKN
ncbi:unnamed protein product [Urochloa decumbens]|uniref:RNase H type-1 domain-containing protein n=1 Tax=Urochloa decumbens TaxID=240449 RepID=A0ABC9EVY2_9POAL